MSAEARRIAMWSGPRNISTAMMRSWENRPDTVVCDEPFYAYYLSETGLDHPGREAVLADQPIDWRAVAEQLTGPVPQGANIYYQKHMSHHLLPGIERDWMEHLDHVLLIRRPKEMLASLDAKLDAPTLDDTGLPQQVALAHWLTERNGTPPLVLDSRDVLEDPAGMLRSLCAKLQLPFDTAMLSWPAGPRESDGIWAEYWYENVWNSTGFQRYRPKEIQLDPRLIPICDACDKLYNQLYATRLRVLDGSS